MKPVELDEAGDDTKKQIDLDSKSRNWIQDSIR